jgi:hypothetical protein
MSERDRRHNGAPEALRRPGRDQQPLGARHAASERGEREERYAEQEQLALAEQIAQPPAEQEEAAVGEHVRVHHPYERGLGEAQGFPDRRQRDVHDRRIEHDHQLAGAQHVEREPAFVFFDQFISPATFPGRP